jgi:hypothetical protein
MLVLVGLLVAGWLVPRAGFFVTASGYCLFGMAMTAMIALRWRRALWPLSGAVEPADEMIRDSKPNFIRPKGSWPHSGHHPAPHTLSGHADPSARLSYLDFQGGFPGDVTFEEYEAMSSLKTLFVAMPLAVGLLAAPMAHADWHGHGGGYHGGGYHGGYHGGGRGPGVAGAIIGLGAAAVIGGVIASQAYAPPPVVYAPPPAYAAPPPVVYSPPPPPGYYPGY